MKVRFAVAPSGQAQQGPEIMAFADAVEASGFDGVWLSDVPLMPVLDPLLALVPVGPLALRELILRHIEAGLSKFVLRPAAPGASWSEEIDELASAILDLQS